MSEVESLPVTETIQAQPLPESQRRNWWQVGDAMVLLVYSAVVLFTVRYHEKWADEAQAWLLARDLDLRTLWFHELRYEGSPGLWHTILWVAQRVFHASYDSMSYIGVAFAIAGAALLISTAPFPRYVRWPLAFTYVMVYQYAVIARPYTMLPLFAFAAALWFKDIDRPVRLTVVLVLLAMLTLHGAILAGCLGLGYLVEVIQAWPRLQQEKRNTFIICTAVMALTFIFIVLILKPTGDVAEFAPKDPRLPAVTPVHKVITAICGAFLDFTLPSFAFLAVAGAWCFIRGKLLVFALPVSVLGALYAVVHGYAHHQGTLFVAAVTALWIAWPNQNERATFRTRDKWMFTATMALLICLCAVNIWDAAVVVRREYLYPYSGGKDAAEYLKSVEADHDRVFGYLFGIVAVQAYFDHNIFANQPTAYFHLGLRQSGTSLDVEEVQRIRPEYLVAYSIDPQQLMNTNGPVFAALGYEMVHFSDGYYLYKRSVYQRETYLIFRRVTPAAAQTP